jgi:hypothetical protein
MGLSPVKEPATFQNRPSGLKLDAIHSHDATLKSDQLLQIKFS